jgi:predicted RNA-binding protein with TRAM domain
MPDNPRFISQGETGRDQDAVEAVRTEIYERDNHTCQYCQNQFERSELTIEHIVPVSKKGINDRVNYVTACRSCNSSKRDEDLSDFLNRRDDLSVSAEDIPIHGDIVLDTIELPQDYREARFNTYHGMRKRGQLKGSDAYQKLEKRFREKLKQTNCGERLESQYPNLPWHVVASIPLVNYLAPDPSPARDLLIEFCKSAQTRALIDDMVRMINPQGGVNRATAIRQTIEEALNAPESRAKRVRWAIDRAGLDGIPENLFENEIPVREGETYDIEITDLGDEGDGIARVDGYVLIIPDTDVGSEVTVRVNHVSDNVGFGEVVQKQ